MNAPLIDKVGLYDDVPDDVYHSDPVVTPSLNSTVCKEIIAESARHAWLLHPRLNHALAETDKEPSRAQDIGTAAHKLILGKGRLIKELPFDDYKKKPAQEARDAARAAGAVPILSEYMSRVRTLHEAFFDQLPGTELEDLFNNGTGEVTGVWQDIEDTWCRMRIDWLPDNARAGGHITIVDLKTANSVEPEAFTRSAYDLGYNISDAFYKRGCMALIPNVRSVDMLFAAIEQKEPHALTVHRFGGQAFDEADKQVDLAIGIWAGCLESGKWPGFDKETNIIDPPRWRSMSAEMRRLGMLRFIERMQRPHERKRQAAE